MINITIIIISAINVTLMTEFSPDSTPKSFGEICYRIGYVEERDRVRLELLSISNVVPRDGDKENNFSVTISVLPLTRYCVSTFLEHVITMINYSYV